MNTKKTKKNELKVLTVDLSNIKNPTDAYKEFAIAKYNMLRNVERDIISAYTVDLYYQALTDAFYSELADECVERIKCAEQIKSTKKPNIFKRFWNWITRKK